MKRLLILLLVSLAGAGCGRVQKKSSTPVREPSPAPRVAPAAPAALPDYGARAKEEIGREQRQELQTKVGQLKVELPPATKK